jgi:hypothetical protein
MFTDRQKITNSNNDSMRIYINTYEFESNYSPSKPAARPDLSGNVDVIIKLTMKIPCNRTTMVSKHKAFDSYS